MGHHTVYSGDLAIWKVCNPANLPTDSSFYPSKDTPIEENFDVVFRAMCDKLEDTRLVARSDAGFAYYDNSMAFSVSEEYYDINPRTALRTLRDAAEILGKWGCYMDGNLFAYNDNLGHMFRLVADKEWLRLFRYDHQGSLKEAEPVVGLIKVAEYDLSDFVDRYGKLPLSKEEEEKRQKEIKNELKRKREEEEETYNQEDSMVDSCKELVKGVRKC